MKVLWITNILFPEAEKLILNTSCTQSFGGWMVGAATALLNIEKNIQLFIATVSKNVNRLTVTQGSQITYFTIPYGKGNEHENKEYEPYWKQINQQISPDVVHIHGTEFSHGLAYMKACGAKNVVISIQGLLSVCEKYYLGGLSNATIFSHITFRDICRKNLWQEKRSFNERSKYEKEMLLKTKHVIGRTDWDRAHCKAINPQAIYHFNNETLRPAFYKSKRWNYTDCQKHHIFVSQSAYPVKGLHQLLYAMPYILKYYPDTTIDIAGRDITADKTFSQRLHRSGYGAIIKDIIKKLALTDKVHYVGVLNEHQMIEHFLKANVYVLPSSIENSPNSLGEAQILGVPCVAAAVGGVTNMIPSAEYGYTYRFSDIEMLAQAVCDCFEKNDNFDTEKVHTLAYERHHPKTNADELIKIYHSIQNVI